MKKFITYKDLYRFLLKKLSYGFNIVLFNNEIKIYPFTFFDSRSLRLFGLLLSTHPHMRIIINDSGQLHAVIWFI